jgi:branched-chain amino acid transport system substrate-binding protein
LTRRGFRYVVNILSPANRYFSGLLNLVRAQLPSFDRLFLAYGPNGTFARSVIDGAEAHARRLGFTTIGKAPYPTNSDFAPLAAEIAEQQPDVLLGAGRFEADVALAHALRTDLIAPPVVSLVAAGVAEFGARLGSAANGFYGPSQWESVDSRPDFGPTATEFDGGFRARFGDRPEYPAAQTYAAGLIIQRCVELAGTLEDEALRQAADTLSGQTFYGSFRLDPVTGEQIGHTMVVVQWHNGGKRVVWPPSIAGAKPT